MRSPRRTADRAAREPRTPLIAQQSSLNIDALRLIAADNQFVLNPGISLSAFLESANATPHLQRGRGNRRSTLAIVATPYLTGEVLFRQPRNRMVSFTARLNLNPSRLQGTHPHGVDELKNLDAQELIAPNQLLHPRSAETLDGANNFIPDARQLPAVEHMALVRQYIAAAFQFVDHWLFEVAGMMGARAGSLTDFMLTEDDEALEENYVRRHNWTECTVYRCEVYAEPNVPEAIDHVHRVAPVLASQSLVSQRREYPASRAGSSENPQRLASAHRVSNSPSVTLALGREDVELSLYAKTVDKVRYEVRYKNNLRRLLGRSAPRRRAGVSDVDGVMELLAVAVEDAGGRLDRISREVGSALDTMPRRLPTFVNLVYYLSQAAGGNRRILTDLTTLLVREGGIEPDTAPHLLAPCSFLVSTQARVLRRATVSVRSPRRRYVLTQRYRPFVDLLRELIDMTD